MRLHFRVFVRNTYIYYYARETKINNEIQDLGETLAVFKSVYNIRIPIIPIYRSGVEFNFNVHNIFRV